MADDDDRRLQRRGRIAALVMVAGGLLAFFAPLLTLTFGLSPRWEILCYLVSMAAFFWALVETWSIWQRRRDDKDGRG